MIAIAGRSGVGQEFELEFSGYLTGLDIFVAVPESKTFRNSWFVPGSTAVQTTLRWVEHCGEQRLVVEMGTTRTPFDDAPAKLRAALRRQVEKFACLLRKGRYET